VDDLEIRIEKALQEARTMANDPRITKSESGRLSTVYVVRIFEILGRGAPVTEHRPTHHV
jgi:hypothetical protein